MRNFLFLDGLSSLSQIKANQPDLLRLFFL